MHTETYIADDNATLISKSFRDLKKYLDMVSYGQISIPYLTRFKKVIINNARSDFCVDEVKSLLSRGYCKMLRQSKSKILTIDFALLTECCILAINRSCIFVQEERLEIW